MAHSHRSIALPKETGTPLVEVRGLSRQFGKKGWRSGSSSLFYAVKDVDLVIAKGEAVGVVGESGCGKSTLGRMILRLLTPTEGTIDFAGQDISRLSDRQMRPLRQRMQMIFQDPFGSLDPKRRIGDQIADALKVHKLMDAKQARARVDELLVQVGLKPEHADRRPHEYSGGQRQRVAIARALAPNPDFIVADEPIASLDVSIQAQVVNLLADLRAKMGLSLLFISHDLHVVRHLCDRIVVMYLGRVVEEGTAQEVFNSPRHPYTRILLEASPSLKSGQKIKSLKGEIPSPANPPSGCGFRTRCPMAISACAEIEPPLVRSADRRGVACIRAGEMQE
jgi:oligopeptide/dipeptide ABC transporter ATP-binding protein